MEIGVSVFDQLTCGQRIVVLANVATHLLKETEDYPALSAINESAVAAIFENIRANIVFELDELNSNTGPSDPEPFSWRSMILSACKQAEIEELPDINNLDYFEWDINLEVLEDRVLWDRDFENGDVYLDLNPEHIDYQKKMMGINDEYFTTIAPDPTNDEIQRAIKTLLNLTR